MDKIIDLGEFRARRASAGQMTSTEIDALLDSATEAICQLETEARRHRLRVTSLADKTRELTERNRAQLRILSAMTDDFADAVARAKVSARRHFWLGLFLGLLIGWAFL